MTPQNEVTSDFVSLLVAPPPLTGLSDSGRCILLVPSGK